MTQAPDLSRRKGQFYRSALDDSMAAKLIEALEIEGIDDEIAFIRTWLYANANHQQYRAITGAINTIVNAAKARYRMTPQDADELVRRMAEEVERAARQIDADTQRMRSADV
jgi:hypothetical protein